MLPFHQRLNRYEWRELPGTFCQQPRCTLSAPSAAMDCCPEWGIPLVAVLSACWHGLLGEVRRTAAARLYRAMPGGYRARGYPRCGSTPLSAGGEMDKQTSPAGSSARACVEFGRERPSRVEPSPREPTNSTRPAAM